MSTTFRTSELNNDKVEILEKEVYKVITLIFGKVSWGCLLLKLACKGRVGQRVLRERKWSVGERQLRRST